MDNEKLEILMGKFFDGEIEPSEKRLLDAHLAKDPLNRRLFEEFQMLHIQAQAELACLADQGRSFESIFAAAWNKRGTLHHRRFKLPGGTFRFVSGMAAGLLLAVLIQFAYRPAVSQNGATAANRGVEPTPQIPGPDRILTHAANDASSPVIKDVDYYYYIDENGQQWLIEGYRENLRTQLVSYQDL
ncbi:MAG: hypothetical protein GX298_04325 [Planctomycetes bacterium]|nr:hypothetical protein [Planctomycetota bacterium]